MERDCYIYMYLPDIFPHYLSIGLSECVGQVKYLTCLSPVLLDDQKLTGYKTRHNKYLNVCLQILNFVGC